MKVIVGAVLIFAAAWVMVRLQTGGGSGTGEKRENQDPYTGEGQLYSESVKTGSRCDTDTGPDNGISSDNGGLKNQNGSQ